jgi:transcription initiation factor TFIID subunit 6
MAMNNLKQDSVVIFIMPKLSLFITETVRVNCVTKEMIYLIYAMRMVQALLENENLDIPTYLHEIIPTVVTCVVSHNFCKQPGVLNHYALRDFAAKIGGKICGAYHNSVNNIGFRVRGMYIHALERKPAQLAAIYGGVTGLAELGDAVVIRFLEPRLKEIGDTLRAFMESNGCSAADMKCALTIKELITKIMTNTLRRKLQSLWKSKPETFDTFDSEQCMDQCMAQYGHLGATIHSIILGLRKQETADKKKQAKSLKRPHN